MVALWGFALLFGCQTAPDASSSARNPASGGGTEPVATVIDARPAALIGGRGVAWGDLRPALTERAGAEILREYILNRAVTDTASERSIEVTADDIARERKFLAESLNPDPNTALRLLDQLRTRQGLGRYRFNALLKRNAALRAMVQDGVEVTEDTIVQLHAMAYGPKRQARLIIVPTLNHAQLAIARTIAGERFADLATELSSDVSASRGGMLQPIARNDPSYPAALRRALWELEIGELSDPILLDDRFAVLLYVRSFKAEDVPLGEVREDLRKRARLNQERLLMDQLARDLVVNVSVTVFDDELHEAWQRAQRAAQ